MGTFGAGYEPSCPCHGWAAGWRWVEGHHPDCDGTGQRLASGVYRADFAPEPTLQLLIIDLGDSTLVKIERNTTDVQGYEMPMETCDLTEGNSWLERYPFEQIRAAIDALEEKPVPRIERDGKQLRVWIYPAYDRVITGDTYNALSELAGRPLPVFTPQAGTWRQIIATTDDEDTPFDVWRFTK